MFSKGFSWFCICLTIRGMVVFEFSSLGPKSLFLLFWQMKIMARRWRKYDRFLSSEWWAVSGEFWVMRGRDVCVQRPKSLLTQIAPISPKGLDIRTFWAMGSERWAMSKNSLWTYIFLSKNTHNSSLIGHHSVSNIFTFVHKSQIGFKMNKNRLK